MLVPAVTGDFGVMPGHVPTVAQLRPGVITVHTQLDKDVEKYFVSSGFAFVHADSSADVVAVEAVKLDELDTEAVRAGLQVGGSCLLAHRHRWARLLDQSYLANRVEQFSICISCVL